MNTLSLSQEQYQIIIGGLLGDSYYKKSNNIIRLYHSTKQEEYLKWKYSFFDHNQVSRLYHGKRTINNREYEYIYFTIKKNTLNDISSFILHNLYSNDGRKKISMKYLNELSPLGLAIWWLDDGCLSVHKGNRYGKLCTHCFNYEENVLIQKFFHEKYGIDVDIKKEKDYYFIRLNVCALKKMISLIYPYICQIPCMIYKIDLNYKNNVNLGEFESIYYYIKNHYNCSLTTTGVA